MVWPEATGTLDAIELQDISRSFDIQGARLHVLARLDLQSAAAFANRWQGLVLRAVREAGGLVHSSAALKLITS